MSADVVLYETCPPLEARGRHRRRDRRPDDLHEPREDRRPAPPEELDDSPRRTNLRPRRRGKHGCDRVRGQGTRRRID